MEMSSFLLKMTDAAMKAIIKTTNADIRIHDEKNIPNQPVLYVINHFTRIETFILPYIIHKITGKVVLSLAFHDLFGGTFGNYLSKVGAISTQDPNRDRIMISALLKGDLSCLIFPEGQMVKDKKLIEKGKYMIYNTGIRRPPHTGAAVLALRSEFYREKLRFFKETGFTEGINKFSEIFEFDASDLNKILKMETNIVPVNITYFPIRAHKNILNKIARLFVDSLPKHIEEELEVEGAMIVDGVDIDINFGKPISIKSYLETKPVINKIKDKELYLSDSEIKRGLSFKKQSFKLMCKYMNSIYEMTTVNHDHIFSYMLTKCKNNKIKEYDFKNRAYLAIKSIKNVPIKSFHTSIKKKQKHLLSDEEHKSYNSFIEAAESDGLIKLEHGYIIKNMERFARPYEFHSIRKNNIVEVLKNEIEPLTQLVKFIDRIMWLPSFYVRKKIRDAFIGKDNSRFEKDYGQFYDKKESKPKEIGRPFLLKHVFNKYGILLIHGYLAAPEEVRAMAEYLYNSGYTVYCPRLVGHGTSPEDLATRTWQEWYDSVNRGYIVLKNCAEKMAMVGFSTGAGLALLQSVNKPDSFICNVSISTPLKLKNIASNFATTVVFWNNILKKMHINKGKMEYIENRPENPHINYFHNPVHGVKELEKLMDAVDKILKFVNLPTLVIQGSNDPVVNPESAMDLFDRLGTSNKELCRIYSTRHGIINGDTSHQVFIKVKRFLDDYFGISKN